MADYKPGSMDTEEQKKTFDGFVRLTKISVIVILVALILLYIING